MFSGMRNERTDACVSDLRFDAWFADELEESEARDLQQHVGECAGCRNRKLELLHDRARFAVAFPSVPEWLAPPNARRMSPRRRKLWLSSGVWAAAAAVIVAVGLSPREVGVRSKGGESLSFYVKRADEVHRGRAGEQVRPGDRLRFTYSSAHARYLTILSLDGAGRVSVYYPSGPHAAAIEPGTDVPLPSAVELDAELGREHIMALFCEEAVALEPLIAALSRERDAMQAPAGCRRSGLTIDKQAPTP